MEPVFLSVNHFIWCTLKKTYRDHALAVVYMSDIIQRDSVPTLQRCVPPRESGKLTTRQRQRGSKTYRN